MKEKVRAILQDIFKQEIPDDFSRFTADGWESLRHLEVIVSLESAFHISFTPEEIGELDSFSSLVECVNKKI